MVEDFNSIQKKFMRLKLARNMNLSKKEIYQIMEHGWKQSADDEPFTLVDESKRKNNPYIILCIQFEIISCVECTF